LPAEARESAGWPPKIPPVYEPNGFGANGPTPCAVQLKRAVSASLTRAVGPFLRRQPLPRPLAWAHFTARRWRYGVRDVAVRMGGSIHLLGRWANAVYEYVGNDELFRGWLYRQRVCLQSDHVNLSNAEHGSSAKLSRISPRRDRGSHVKASCNESAPCPTAEYRQNLS